VNAQPTTWFSPPADLQLRISDVHVWRSRLDQPDCIVKAFNELLSSDERTRAARFRFQRDRSNFVVARGVLRSLLSTYLPLAPAEFRFNYGRFGKPELIETAGVPSLRFNISHAHQLALFVFAWSRKVGVDVEYIRRNLSHEEIAGSFFSSRELKALLKLPAEKRAQGFFNCWTRKEAYIKARGEGVSLPLDQFDVSLIPGEPAALLGTAFDPQDAARWSLRELCPGPGYSAAIAVEGNDWNLTTWQL
jgi:4'-phosphopantetheinyl transferase